MERINYLSEIIDFYSDEMIRPYAELEAFRNDNNYTVIHGNLDAATEIFAVYRNDGQIILEEGFDLGDIQLQEKDSYPESGEIDHEEINEYFSPSNGGWASFVGFFQAE